jgi:glycosyltransferase involved in cell wall biosynthesis
MTATEPPSMAASTRVSILSAVRNESLHIGEMIESVIAQSHADWELVLVDDGSTDDTAAIITRYGDASPKVRLASSGHKIGKVAAFNRAYAVSTGDLVVLMGGDDVMASESLAIRVRALGREAATRRVVGLFKLRTFSDDPRFDQIVLPRGASGSRSGPSLTLSRPLAELVFPIPEHLVSEDTWLSEATAALAEEEVHSQHVVVNYRIHAGNSNPRHKSFADMDIAMHKRAQGLTALVDETRFSLSPASRARIAAMVQAEEYRHAGRTLRLLTQRGTPLMDRLALASMSSPALFRVRTRFFRFFSGRRGR